MVRSKPFRQLHPDEQQTQPEEAYARATVALTRAQTLCVIMGPLDMKGLMGAAAVIGCLKYGAGLCGMGSQERLLEMHLRESSITSGPDDGAFLDSLRRSLVNSRGVYPPVALAEIFCEDHHPDVRIRRLHLIVVDLDHSRYVSRRVLKQFAAVDMSVRHGECFNTLPVPITDPAIQGRCRFVYGYGTDGSDLPCYLVWPLRHDESRCCLHGADWPGTLL